MSAGGRPFPALPAPGTTDLVTGGGIRVRRTVDVADPVAATEACLDRLDGHRGAFLTSTYEYPGRYRRWIRAFADPPLALTARGRGYEFTALNPRGDALLRILTESAGLTGARGTAPDGTVLRGEIPLSGGPLVEEQRSRLPSVFSVLRQVRDALAGPDPYLGLYGAFGYDLVLQFEDLHVERARDPGQRDLVLYLPDELLVGDGTAVRRVRYDFEHGPVTTTGLPRSGAEEPFVPAPPTDTIAPSTTSAAFREVVDLARDAFRRGDLFEVVSSRLFRTACPDRPSRVFRRLRAANPAPYGALVNLGEREYLVAASPEMYVRVHGSVVETCPISGTVARGASALEDEQNIRSLLNSEKDHAELTMCTDVDRNDKSRVCVSGSVEVVGRRQIEMYSTVIHTVDHVRGRLLPACDGIDAFVSHIWASTVTGAPKLWAMRFNERYEREPRRWYGGAFGWMAADGRIESGIVLRTIRVADGTAEVRAGCTLLIDSEPEGEDVESRLKAAAFLKALEPDTPAARTPAGRVPAGVPLLLVDNEDSFVHTLANYLRQAGARVTTVRAPIPQDRLLAVMEEVGPRLVVLSPGPGLPGDFGMERVIGCALERGCGVFGVCLGLQGIAEYFGAELCELDHPMHGRSSLVTVGDSVLFEGLPATIEAGRYHSVYVRRASLPSSLRVIAEADGAIMGLEHATLPVSGVQFHPESLLSARDGVGIAMIRNLLARVGDRAPGAPATRTPEARG